MKRRTVAIVGFAAVILALAALPFGVSNYMIRVATIGFMYVALASSWNIVGGFTGYPSFAVAAFFGAGAYTAAVLRVTTAMPLPLAWTFAAIASAIFATAVGAAILRLRGHYFAVASLVLAPVLQEIVNGATSITGGGMGLNIPFTGSISVDLQGRIYYVSMLIAALLTIGVAALIRLSKLGWAMRCIEQNEDAAIVLGVNTFPVKLVAFAASAATAGLVGAIYATWIGYIDPTDVFDDMLSVKPIVMAFIGGIGTIMGPVAGGIIFLLLEEFVWRNVLDFHSGILGILIVLLLVFVPGGLGGIRLFMTNLRCYRPFNRTALPAKVPATSS
jgi:branched-chain amino acid transport system permease protein